MAASTEATSSYHAHRGDAGTQQMYKSEDNVESMRGNCITAATVATYGC
jgi:hypothetical protein